MKNPNYTKEEENRIFKSLGGTIISLIAAIAFSIEVSPIGAVLILLINFGNGVITKNMTDIKPPQERSNMRTFIVAVVLCSVVYGIGRFAQ